MDRVDTPLALIFVPILILANAFFVAAEYAVVAIRPVQLESMRQAGQRRAADAMATLKARTADAIATIQVCITATNLLLGWLGEPAMTWLLRRILGGVLEALPDAAVRPTSTVISFLCVTLLTVVFSELVPKALTLRHAETVASLAAVPILMVQNLVKPLVVVMNVMANVVTVPLGFGRVDQPDEARNATEELRLMATEAAKEGVLTPRERVLILNTLSIGRRPARHLMIPRVEVSYLDLQWTMDENRNVINQRLFSRLPLCNGGLDNMVGIVNTKEFFSAYHAAGDVSVLQLIAGEAHFAPEIATADQLLQVFHNTGSEMLCLVDEFGGLAGIITLRDVVRDLIGAVDESRALVEEGLKGDIASKPSKPGWRLVRGNLALHELARMIDRDQWAHDESAATVGGLMQHRLGRVPKPGEQVEVDGFVLRVVSADARAVRRVEVAPVELVQNPRRGSISK
jgi:CBS domain containing-hemolysin-like protein